MSSSLRPRQRASAQLCAFALALAIALVPARSEAIAPALLFVLKQIAQDMAKSMLKDALLSGLSGMGCKGIALANALEALDLRRSAGGGGGIGGMVGAMSGGLSKVPVGAAKMPAGMPDLSALAGMPSLPGMPALPGATAGLGAGAAPAELAARMRDLMPGVGQMPAGMGLAPDQMAMMASMLQSMGEPLSPAQTVATIDELAELGFLPKAVQSELKACMVVLPASIPALGMGMGMLRPIVPQLRQAREQMRALSADEQDEVAAALAAEIAPLPKEQRAEFVAHLGSGFFPPRISDGVKQRLAAR